MSELEYIIEAIKDRAPGPGPHWFTVDKNTLFSIKWNNLVGPPIEKFVADEVDGIMQYDKYGNPQFQLTAQACRERTRREIKKLLEFELCTRSVMFHPEMSQNELLDKIMSCIEKEGRYA